MADIRITGRMVNFTRLTLDTNDHHAIREQLTQMLQDTGSQGALVVLDSTVEQELIAIIQLLISLNLQPMAVVEGLLGDEARLIQFPVLPADRPLQRIKATKEQVVEVPPVTPVAPTPAAVPESAPAPVVEAPKIRHATSYHDDILRTGQCLIQDHGDIIMTAGLNSGAEAIASGNIHIYGTVRGRVIAGAGGNQEARIFCQSLEAELISIAGTYCVADDIPAHLAKQPVHIFLNDNQELVFKPLEI